MILMDRLEVLLWCIVVVPAALGGLSLLFESLNRKDT